MRGEGTSSRMTRDSFRARRTRICSHPTRASPLPKKRHVCLMCHTCTPRLNPAFAEMEEAATKEREAAKTQQQHSQYQHQHQGNKNSLKITKYVGVQRKILT